MLTKTDLSQTRGVVREEVDTIVDEKLDPVKKDLKTLKKDVKYLKKTVDIIVSNYDEADVKLDRGVKKIEQHLELP
jgi:peptidoglycan hydrolase CwlO-like protein